MFSNLDVFWKEYKILTVKNIDDIYYTCIDDKGISKAKDDGLLLGVLGKMSIVSNKLPGFIKERIPNNVEEMEDIMQYLRETEGRFETDYLSIKVS